MIDCKYYVNVSLLMLPRPILRDNVLDSDRAESISELGIISVNCKDVDYYDNDNRGIHR